MLLPSLRRRRRRFRERFFDFLFFLRLLHCIVVDAITGRSGIVFTQSMLRYIRAGLLILFIVLHSRVIIP